MTKNYLYSILFFLMLSTTSVLAQDGKPASKVQENTIEGLSFYPNPATGGKIYISTKYNELLSLMFLEKKYFKLLFLLENLTFLRFHQEFILLR